MLVIKQFTLSIYIESISFPTMEVNEDQQLFGSSKCLFLFKLREKCIGLHVWNNMRVSKWWQHFQFWVNYNFKQEYTE